MRGKLLHLEQYDTDKIDSNYLEQYDPILEPWLDKEVHLLELGIYKGGSLQLWRDYFTSGTIAGIDYRIPEGMDLGERIQVFEGSQQDTEFLTKVANETAPEGFDIIIDDASHLGELTKTSFWHLFDNHLKSPGLYVIEDWGTGYLSDWPDGKAFKQRRRLLSKMWFAILAKCSRLGKVPIRFRHHSHSYGMVGFIKELVDEMGAADATRGRIEGAPTRTSKFEEMVITPSIVFIKKRGTQVK